MDIQAREAGPRYRVWHIPQVPGKAFYREVDSLSEALTLSETLADYDLFQYENRIKPDYANAGGVEVWEDGEWVSVDMDEEYV